MKLVYEHDYPKPGEKWKHFKGHVYEIICIAGDTERRAGRGVPGYPKN